MAKDIEKNMPIGAGASQGLDPRRGYGPKVCPGGSTESTKVFLDAVWRTRPHRPSHVSGETGPDGSAQELD
jgi:hypothetical protein